MKGFGVGYGVWRCIYTHTHIYIICMSVYVPEHEPEVSITGYLFSLSINSGGNGGEWKGVWR